MSAAAFSLDLFAGAMTPLVDDAEGGVRYWPGFVDARLAQEWFLALQAKAGWTHLQRPMYDRIVDVPRLVASYRTDAFPPELPLAQMLGRVRQEAPAPYNGVGLNLYQRRANGRDCCHRASPPVPPLRRVWELVEQ